MADADLTWAVLLATAGEEDDVPEGWNTISQIAQSLGRDDVTIARRMRAALAAGTVETRKFRIRTGECIRPVAHYRLIGVTKGD